ncbi:MAG: MFS transporter [Clostridiales bacterium]|nr:MFS transporter [Clostridiales bacterium]
MSESETLKNPEILKPIKKGSTFAILIMPFVWLFEGAVIAAALGPLAADPIFKEVSQFQIQLMYVIPFLSSILFSIIAGFAARRIDKKTLAIIGLLIYGVMGLLPAFASNILLMTVERFIMGIGVGLVLPLTNAYIAEYFAGKKRSEMLGYASSVSMISNLVATFIAGTLLTLGQSSVGIDNEWRFDFYAFVIPLIIMVIVIIWLPKSPPAAKTETAQQLSAPKEKLPVNVAMLTLLMAFSWCVFILVILNDSVFMVNGNIVDAAPTLPGTTDPNPYFSMQMSMSMAFPTGAAIIMGFFYEKIHRAIKNWLPFVAFLSMTIGFIIYAHIDSYWQMCTVNFLTGIGVGLFTPFCVDIIIKRTKPEQHDRATGIGTAGIHMGQFCAPFLQILIAAIIGTAALRPMYTSAGVIFAVAAIVSLYYLRHKEPAAVS